MNFEEARELLQNKLTPDEAASIVNLIISEYERTSLDKQRVKETIIDLDDKCEFGQCCRHVRTEDLLKALDLEEEE